MLEAVANFFSVQSERFGPSGILPHHEARAQRIDRALGGSGRVLELGCGSGGAAAATARLGYDVTAVELSPVRARFARELAATISHGPEIVEGDFLTAAVGSEFELVAYWNGFGMGSDDDQRALLRRVAKEWLVCGGVMLVDVFNPAGWARVSAEPKLHEECGAVQQTTFDAGGCRFVDRWWPIGAEDQAIEQSIRCYSPADLVLLLEGTGMRLDHFGTEDGGTLDDSFSYLAILDHDS